MINLIVGNISLDMIVPFYNKCNFKREFWGLISFKGGVWHGKTSSSVLQLKEWNCLQTQIGKEF